MIKKKAEFIDTIRLIHGEISGSTKHRKEPQGLLGNHNGLKGPSVEVDSDQIRQQVPLPLFLVLEQ